jgi:hypothetical protein
MKLKQLIKIAAGVVLTLSMIFLAGTLRSSRVKAQNYQDNDEARADCQHVRDVRGSHRETIIPSPNDPFRRVLGNVDGVLNGASTAFITSFNPPPAPFIVLNATSFDVFVTNRG